LIKYARFKNYSSYLQVFLNIFGDFYEPVVKCAILYYSVPHTPNCDTNYKGKHYIAQTIKRNKSHNTAHARFHIRQGNVEPDFPSHFSFVTCTINFLIKIETLWYCFICHIKIAWTSKKHIMLIRSQYTWSYESSEKSDPTFLAQNGSVGPYHACVTLQFAQL
jgi:hypothetical protein